MAYALFRLPFADRYTLLRQTSGQAEELASPVELSGREGFVVAPFSTSGDVPLLLIRADERKEFDFSGTDQHFSTIKSEAQESSLFTTYAIDFANFHSHLQSGEFQKLVLSRSVSEPMTTEESPRDLFLRACSLYPRMFISLVSTERGGTWLTASPEILLDGEGDRWQTMALAGTMRYTDNPTWNDKNREEQQLVATYITETLERFTDDFAEEGPYSTRAADLVHLRSDFRFHLADTSRIGELIAALHPTPAVCGLPKQRAFQFILHNESSPRRYYSGFMGPLFPRSGTTHLYVSLRCMEIGASACRLYAGGGILPDSVMEQEWQETEMKLETMRQCLAIEKT